MTDNHQGVLIFIYLISCCSLFYLLAFLGCYIKEQCEESNCCTNCCKRNRLDDFHMIFESPRRRRSGTDIEMTPSRESSPNHLHLNETKNKKNEYAYTLDREPLLI